MLPGPVGRASDSRARCPGFNPFEPHTLVFPSTDSRRAVVSYWQKYVHEILVKLRRAKPVRESVVKLTDHPDMTIAVYCGHKTTTQQFSIALQEKYLMPVQTANEFVPVLNDESTVFIF